MPIKGRMGRRFLEVDCDHIRAVVLRDRSLLDAGGVVPAGVELERMQHGATSHKFRGMPETSALVAARIPHCRAMYRARRSRSRTTRYSPWQRRFRASH